MAEFPLRELTLIINALAITLSVVALIWDAKLQRRIERLRQ